MTTTTTAPPTAPDTTMKLPLWTSGDTNAFFGLGFNVMVNVLVLTGLCLGVVHIPDTDVFGVILPAMGIQLLIGNVYYTYLARRLARRENRDTVTAMPYGPSVPHMFIVTFVIMLPTYLATKNAFDAWAAGLAWCFIIGCIVLIGAFVGPYVRKYTPRAAMLGTLAGISIAFISMRPAAQMWEALWIALPVLDHHHDRLLHRPEAAGQHARSAWRRCSSAPRSAGSAATCTPPTSPPPRTTSRSACPASTSAGSATACPRSRRCSPPPSRSGSTTSPRA